MIRFGFISFHSSMDVVHHVVCVCWFRPSSVASETTHNDDKTQQCLGLEASGRLPPTCVCVSTEKKRPSSNVYTWPGPKNIALLPANATDETAGAASVVVHKEQLEVVLDRSTTSAVCGDHDVQTILQGVGPTR
jgi:hypothetical protein